MKLDQLGERAKEQLARVTGFKPVGVVGVSRDNGGWQLSIDMLEMVRVPDSTDLLGTYLVSLDEKGEIVRFQKRGSHLRGEPQEEGASSGAK